MLNLTMTTLDYATPDYAIPDYTTAHYTTPHYSLMAHASATELYSETFKSFIILSFQSSAFRPIWFNVTIT